MRRIKLLGALASLTMAACLLSSCSLGVQFLQAYMDARETQDLPARETAAAPGWGTPSVRETAPPAQPPADQAPEPEPPTNPPAPPEITQAAAEPELFCGPGWFEGVMGSRFYLPEGFVQQSPEGYMLLPGTHTYVFLNDQLGMKIDVLECTLDSLIMTPQEDYKGRASQEGVTYATAGNGYYVVSGYSDNQNIYYIRADHDQSFYHSVSFYYPVDYSGACEEILLEFLRNYSTD